MKLFTLFIATFFLGLLQFLGPASRLPPARFLYGRGAAGTPAERKIGAAAVSLRRLRAVARKSREAEAALRAVEQEERRIRSTLGLDGAERGGNRLTAAAAPGGDAVLLARLESLERQRLALEELRAGLAREAALLSGRGRPPRNENGRTRYDTARVGRGF